jgi:pimeloyl-ACP methyl ester carboxylesterase
MNQANRITLKDGRHIAYAEYGDAEGVPLIGFHGMPGSRLAMKVFHECALDMHLRIIAPDRPGYGLSSPNASGTLTSYPEDIAELCDHLSIDRFMVMGASGGGPYSIACASHFRNRVTVAGVVSGIGPLALPGSLTGMMRVNRIMFMLGRFSPMVVGFLLPHLIRSSLPTMDKQVQKGQSPSPSIDPTTYAIIVADQREAIDAGGGGIKFDMKNLWRNWNLPFHDIHTKVLLWHGDSDDLAPTALARYVATQLPNAEAVFYPGEDHTGPLTQHREEILRALKQAHLSAS